MSDKMPFGFVVDDDGPDKQGEGGAAGFAERLGGSTPDPGHLARCPACSVLEESYACVGMIATPLAASVERFLVERLPEDIESLPGYLVRKAIAEYGHTGAEGAALRTRGLLAAPGPFTRHFGPFFRRFTVSSEQLIEELLCAGDIAPPHALAVLVHLQLLTIDGRPPVSMDDGPLLAELMNDVPSRRTRAKLILSDIKIEGDDPSLAGVLRLLRAIFAGFVLDAPVKVFAPE